MKKFLLSPILILFVTINVLAQDGPPEVRSVVTQDSTYINSFFNFEFSVPKGWSIQGNKLLDDAMVKGREVIAGDNEALKSALKGSVEKSGSLLAAFQYPLGAPVEFNSSVAIISEDIESLPGITSGADYLFHAKNLMKQAQVKMNPKEISKKKINGREFGMMEVELETPMGQVVNQIYCSTIIKRHSIGIVLTYTNDEQRRVLESALESFR